MRGVSDGESREYKKGEHRVEKRSGKRQGLGNGGVLITPFVYRVKTVKKKEDRDNRWVPYKKEWPGAIREERRIHQG